jgi:hypothetical protein
MCIFNECKTNCKERVNRYVSIGVGFVTFTRGVRLPSGPAELHDELVQIPRLG